MWRALLNMSAKRQIAETLVFDVVHVVDADAAAVDIEAVIQWAVKAAWDEKENERQQHSRKRRLSVRSADVGALRALGMAVEGRHYPLLAMKRRFAEGVDPEIVDPVEGTFAELQEWQEKVEIIV
ncbi:hypothetical protein AMAG_19582 [Allomyces macrogynus ATCC 38327]|uniref:Uncharacterized protein n=1 Tax=Allomyces macrogynus (strain ATCC 38327) TaxID=578462 RepID=A0A0L0SVV1_ALLM3|nr:hypothetical protein AMAG_19582 [Allomyces macrogynus ATCC 38327]|eukprot:KNE66495.1 hypothetical protein AMAG_19582 [Allomyces macrogynus ATCC 38327]